MTYLKIFVNLYLPFLHLLQMLLTNRVSKCVQVLVLKNP